MTLYEVLVALAIFLGALAVLGQSMSTGTRAATQAKLRSQAMLRCEQKLGEVLAGIIPLQSDQGREFEDKAPNWSWDLNVEKGPTTGLLFVTVTATHSGSNSSAKATYSISRYVRDPEVFVIQAEIDAAIQEEANK